MYEARLANVFYEQRGPLVLSASLHLVIILGLLIWTLIDPKKEPEELVFVLESPPPAGVESQSQEVPTPAPLQFKTEDVKMPTLDEIKLPERPKPEPVKQEPEPLIPIVAKPEPKKPEPKKPEPQPKPKTISLQDFEKMNGPIKTTNVPKQTTQPQRQVNLEQIARSLSDFDIPSLPSTAIGAKSANEQSQLQSYLARFRSTIAANLEKHPFRGSPLVAKVSCDISANGRVSNVQIKRSSGDAAFDGKVIAAFRSVRIFDAPPFGDAFVGLTFDVVQR